MALFAIIGERRPPPGALSRSGIQRRCQIAAAINQLVGFRDVPHGIIVRMKAGRGRTPRPSCRTAPDSQPAAHIWRRKRAHIISTEVRDWRLLGIRNHRRKKAAAARSRPSTADLGEKKEGADYSYDKRVELQRLVRDVGGDRGRHGGRTASPGVVTFAQGRPRHVRHSGIGYGYGLNIAGRAVTAPGEQEENAVDFWGRIYDPRSKGLIPREWKRAHLRPHLCGGEHCPCSPLI